MTPDRLLSKMKAYARDRDLAVTWNEVRSRFADEYRGLSRQAKRRVRLSFEGWITRRRVAA